MQPSILAKRLWLLLFLGIVVFYFYGLGHIPFVGPDEPRYAQVAREMFLRHDLTTPTLGGRPWFEKPVLLYWMMMAGYALFGVSEWAARLGPALSGLATIAAVYWIGKRIERATPDSQVRGLALCGALITASSSGMIVFSRGATFDIVVTMTITWALSFFLASELVGNKQKQRRLLAAFYIFVGLSLLAKGLVGIVIPLGVIGGYYIFRRALPQRQTLLSVFWGLPLTLVVAAVWYGPVIMRHGWDFIDQFFIQHHFARYLSDKYHHPESIYFYPLVIVALSLPWSAFLLEALAKPNFRQWAANSPLARIRVFLMAWLLIPLVFFSFSQSKLPGYVLPILPAAALIAAARLARFKCAPETGGGTMRITGAMLLLFAVGGFIYFQQSKTIALACVFVTALPVMLAGALAVFVPSRRSLAIKAIVTATLAAFAIALHCGVTKMVEPESTKNLLQLADARGYAGAPLYALHHIDRSAEFYAAGRVAYGSDGEPLRFEGAFQVADVAKKLQAPILVVVPVEYVSQLMQLESMRIDLIGDNGSLAYVGVSAH